jgi:hypothetical protein
MTFTVFACLLLVAWGASLTLALMLCIRQLSVLTVRLETSASGLTRPTEAIIGTDLSESALRLGPNLAVGERVVILLSATCEPCVQFLEALPAATIPLAREELILLVTGEGGAPDLLVAASAKAVVRVDKDAGHLARALGMTRTPTALLLRNGKVAGQSIVHEPLDIVALIGDTSDHADAGSVSA